VRDWAELLRGVRDLVRACGCETGGPSCVAPATEVDREAKANTLGILRAMIERRDNKSEVRAESDSRRHAG
jgi:hypothetical protein